MSAHLDHIFSLSQSMLAALDAQEQAQTAVHQAVEGLLVTVKCAPDNQESLEEEQNHISKTAKSLE
jgi:hypothetical protein